MKYNFFYIQSRSNVSFPSHAHTDQKKKSEKT